MYYENPEDKISIIDLLTDFKGTEIKNMAILLRAGEEPAIIEAPQTLQESYNILDCGFIGMSTLKDDSSSMICIEYDDEGLLVNKPYNVGNFYGDLIFIKYVIDEEGDQALISLNEEDIECICNWISQNKPLVIEDKEMRNMFEQFTNIIKDSNEYSIKNYDVELTNMFSMVQVEPNEVLRAINSIIANNIPTNDYEVNLSNIVRDCFRSDDEDEITNKCIDVFKVMRDTIAEMRLQEIKENYAHCPF